MYVYISNKFCFILMYVYTVHYTLSALGDYLKQGLEWALIRTLALIKKMMLIKKLSCNNFFLYILVQRLDSLHRFSLAVLHGNILRQVTCCFCYLHSKLNKFCLHSQNTDPLSLFN